MYSKDSKLESQYIGLIAKPILINGSLDLIFKCNFESVWNYLEWEANFFEKAECYEYRI